MRAAQPERTCAACRQKRPQSELLRWTRQSGSWKMDPFPARKGQAREGRGTYLCSDSPTCWQEKRLRRTFGAYAPAVAQQLSTR